MIQLTNLTKKFGNKAAVNDLSMTIPKGELFGFLGPNGAGKTTTIKLIMGMLQPTSGSVEIAGYNMQQDAIKARRHIGYVPDSPYVYEKLTGREYLKFVGEIFGMKSNDIGKAIDKYAIDFNMKSYLDYKTGEYSHGMRQKIVLTSAFMHNPELLVIDEPMVGLDPSSARVVKDLFMEFARKGSTVFISTHTLPLAEEICRRIGIINHGRLITVASQDELRNTAAETGGNLENLFLELTRENATTSRV
ncbi:MAG: ATP-binding cassette domain-containing protein [candidate division Zixibacteria bacterium]|nr:ATP-binding cassette domain-containing protein [candidate division Zixibacteria bacterium]